MEAVLFSGPILYNQYISKNPIINALSASAYIVLVVFVMTFVNQPLKNKHDTFFCSDRISIASDITAVALILLFSGLI